MTKLNENGMVEIAIAVVLALAIGVAGGYTVGHKKDSSTKNSVASSTVPTTDTKAATLRVALNSLEAQHVDLAAAATRAGFDGSPAFTASAGALDKNSHALADAVASVYGKDNGDKFYQIWNSHIGFFVDYTVAAKKGDKAGMDKAVENLNGYVSAVSDFLGGATGLPKDAVASLVTQHVGLLKGAVDKYGAGDYTGSYADQQLARDQITTKIADTLAGAIVKQNPSKF
jgi:hypothetical protein